MIDALFWYTGLVVWTSIVFGAAAMLVVEAYDRSILRDGNDAQLSGRNRARL